MNVIVLTGRIGRAEVKAAGQNNMFTFSLAVPRAYKRQGEVITDWFNCQSFNENIVKNVSQWVSQGDRVSIQGAMEVNKVGENTYYNVNVNQITLLETRAERDGKGNNNNNSNNNNQGGNNNGYHGHDIPTDDDLPF